MHGVPTSDLCSKETLDIHTSHLPSHPCLTRMPMESPAHAKAALELASCGGNLLLTQRSGKQYSNGLENGMACHWHPIINKCGSFPTPGVSGFPEENPVKLHKLQQKIGKTDSPPRPGPRMLRHFCSALSWYGPDVNLRHLERTQSLPHPTGNNKYTQWARVVYGFQYVSVATCNGIRLLRTNPHCFFSTWTCSVASTAQRGQSANDLHISSSSCRTPAAWCIDLSLATDLGSWSFLQVEYNRILYDMYVYIISIYIYIYVRWHMMTLVICTVAIPCWPFPPR